MNCITVISLLAFVTQAHAEDIMDKVVDKLVEKFIDRTFNHVSLVRSGVGNFSLVHEGFPFRNDNTTLWKPGHLQAPHPTVVRPFPLFRAHQGYLRRPGVPTFAANVDTPVYDPRKEGLALLLDDGTRKSHSVAENSAFVTGFFRGIAEKKAFSQLVADLYFVYKAMEEAFAATKDENVRAINYPELQRVPSLEKDMDYYFGTNWRTEVEPSPATAKYVAQIEKVARDQPSLLIAHQYTRYLGDLFGGQMMGGMARKSLSLEDGKGTSFYEFEDIPNTKDFITEWYAKLNNLKLTESEKEAIVDEANLVFRLNIELFDELDGNPIAPLFRLALDSLKQKLGLK